MDAHEAVFDSLRPKPPMSWRTRLLGTALGIGHTLLGPIEHPKAFLSDLKQRLSMNPKDLERMNEQQWQQLTDAAGEGDPKAQGSLLAMGLGLVLPMVGKDLLGAPGAIAEGRSVTPKPLNPEAVQRMLGDMFEPKEGALEENLKVVGQRPGVKPDKYGAGLTPEKAGEIDDFDRWLESVEKSKDAGTHVRTPASEIGDWWRRAYPVNWKHAARASMAAGEDMPPVERGYGYNNIGEIMNLPISKGRDVISAQMADNPSFEEPDAMEGGGKAHQAYLRRLRSFEQNMNDMTRGLIMREDFIPFAGSDILSRVKKVNAFELLKGISKQ